jgi:hypothetical protein
MESNACVVQPSALKPVVVAFARLLEITSSLFWEFTIPVYPV